MHLITKVTMSSKALPSLSSNDFDLVTIAILLVSLLIFLPGQAALSDIVLLLSLLADCQEEKPDTGPDSGKEISEEDPQFSSQ